MKQSNDYEKRALLIKAAKEEFLEKGYNKASLRSICSKAGVTTGALYFFFENKEDLFAAIVDEPIHELRELFDNHFKEDIEYMSSLDSIEDCELDHTDVSNLFVECIYRNYDSIMLLLNSAENTVYENVVDEFVQAMENVMPRLLSAIKGYSCDEFMCHWMAHITIDSYIHVIKHIKDEKEAAKILQGITNYIVLGWMNLVMVKNN